MNPSNRAIADTLRRLALSELPDDHPRKLAPEAVMEFRSNAQRDRLATTNIHDVHGAPVLMSDDVIRASLPPQPAVKTRRGWWARLRWWR